MRRGTIQVWLGSMVVVATLLSGVLSAQEDERRAPGAVPGRERRMGDHRPERGGRAVHEQRARALLRRVAALPPEEQQRVLESDEFFQQLPPPAQERIRRRLQELNARPSGQRQARRGGFEQNRQQELRALFLRVGRLPPEQQDQILAQDPLFQSLPRPLQAQFRQRLERLNQHPPGGRERMLNNLERFQELRPQRQAQLERRAQSFARMKAEERQAARRVFQAWRELPPHRQQLLRERLHRLERAPAEQRSALLEDPGFLSPLEASERELLEQLWHLRQALQPGSHEKTPPAP